MEFSAIVEKEEDMYVAYCSEVGTTSQGSTIEEAMKNLEEATSLYILEFGFKRHSRPILTTFGIKNVKA